MLAASLASERQAEQLRQEEIRQQRDEQRQDRQRALEAHESLSDAFVAYRSAVFTYSWRIGETVSALENAKQRRPDVTRAAREWNRSIEKKERSLDRMISAYDALEGRIRNASNHSSALPEEHVERLWNEASRVYRRLVRLDNLIIGYPDDIEVTKKLRRHRDRGYDFDRLDQAWLRYESAVDVGT